MPQARAARPDAKQDAAEIERGMNGDGVAAHTRSSAGTGAWLKLLAGLAAVFGLFQALGHALGSDRGQSGLVIAGTVVAALVAIECALSRQAPAAALLSLGFGRPRGAGLLAAIGVSLLLLAVIPTYAVLRGAAPALHPGWLWLLPGLFAQAGIAEEALFRGYLFARLRHGRGFWHAAALAAVPFVLVHLVLFATLPWPVASAAVLLSTVLSFPLAHLFELGGRTIWGPAVLHFTVQGAIKVLEIPGDAAMPLVWMAASATLPYLVLLRRRPTAAARS